MRDKARDIARSLLPCKNREAARRAKAITHRTERRGARGELSEYEGRLDRDLLDDCVPGTRPDLEYRAEVSSNVSVRRWGDKLGPFLRWAHARSRTLSDPKKKLARVQKLLGVRTVVTEHALGHFLSRSDFDPHYLSRWRTRPRRDTRPWPDRATLERVVLRAFEERHGELNAFLKAAREPVVQTRDDVARLTDRCWSLEPRSALARAFARFLARAVGR